jgi:hypothetical protein
LYAVAKAELGEDPRDVGLRRTWAEVEQVCIRPAAATATQAAATSTRWRRTNAVREVMSPKVDATRRPVIGRTKSPSLLREMDFADDEYVVQLVG